MKKIVSLLVVLVLALTLVGCEKETAQPIYYNYEFEGKLMIGCTDTTGDTNVCDSYIEIYTQEEVDAMLDDYFTKEEVRTLLENILEDYYTQDELDEGFEDVLNRFEELEKEKDTN